VLDEAHEAWLVTFCVVELDIVAVAVNCDVTPIAGAVPLTATDVTVGVGVGAGDADEVDEPLPPHATRSAARPNAKTDAASLARVAIESPTRTS